MSVGARRAFWSAAAFLLALTGAAWIQQPKAAGNGDQCATVRNGTPTTCPEPHPPMTSEPTTTTSEPAATTTTTTLGSRPPVVDPTPDPEDRTEIDTAIVVDAQPAAPVSGTPETVG